MELNTLVQACRVDRNTRRAGAKTIKKNTNSTQNKSQTHRAKQYEVTSFLSTDCELSTETCSKNVYSLGPCMCLRFPVAVSCSEAQERKGGLWPALHVHVLCCAGRSTHSS